jgi:hypothetical protein
LEDLEDQLRRERQMSTEKDTEIERLTTALVQVEQEAKESANECHALRSTVLYRYTSSQHQLQILKNQADSKDMASAKLTSELKQVKDENRKLTREMNHIKNTQDRALQASLDEEKFSFNKQIEEMKKEHDRNMVEVRTELELQHKTVIDEMKATHDKEIQELKLSMDEQEHNHPKEILNLKESSDQKISDAHSELEYLEEVCNKQEAEIIEKSQYILSLLQEIEEVEKENIGMRSKYNQLVAEVELKCKNDIGLMKERLIEKEEQIIQLKSQIDSLSVVESDPVRGSDS